MAAGANLLDCSTAHSAQGTREAVEQSTNLPATNSFIQLEIYRAPFPLHVGTVLQGNTENQRKTLETTGKHRETGR